MVEKLHGIGLFVAGWIFFPGAFLLLQYLWHFTLTGIKLGKKYGLTDKDRAAISNKIVSAFQAILATTTGSIVCYHCYGNVLYCSHPLTLIYLWFAMPYFFYDTLGMFYIYILSRNQINKDNSNHNNNGSPSLSSVIQFFKFFIKNPMIIVHHLIMAPCGFYLIVFCRDPPRYGDFFVGIILLMEASTPFVSFRFMLSKFKLKSSKLYKINGFLMLFIFPFCRIFSCFYAFELYANQLGLGFFQTFLNIPFLWKLIYCAAVAPQFYWYFLMWKGLINMISNDSTPKKTDEEDVEAAVLLEDESTSSSDTHVVFVDSKTKNRLAEIFPPNPSPKFEI